jgi:subtilase family serine protease
MPSDSFSGPDLSDSPVTVPSQGTYIFDPIVIQIPLGTSSGSHSYFVGIDGTEGLSASSFSWNSPSFTIQIHDIVESIYSDIRHIVENKLNGAISANYASSEAQSLLQQAQSEFDNATSLATQGRWPEAIYSLELADDFLDQAYAAEQSSAEQQAGLQSLLFYLAIIAIVVIIVVSIIVVVVRKKRKQTDAGADQPVETIEEQSEEQS